MTVIKPTHPGEILREEFLKPMGISAYRLAKDIGVPVNRITAITKKECAISPETARLLARYFKVSDELWLNLQTHYDMELAKDSLKDKLRHMPQYKASPGLHGISNF